jgi:hypothetical protein
VVNRIGDSRQVIPDDLPTVGGKNDDRDLTIFQVLLIGEIPIGGYESLEASLFRRRQQFSVPKATPTGIDSCGHVVIWQLQS